MNYAEKAKELRKTVLSMTFHAQSSHIGSNFSAADIMTAMYNIADFSKDIVLVKSWCAANAYALLVSKGLLPQDAVDHYGEEGTQWKTILEPIPPVIPFATGCMGTHLPAAVGFALANKIKKEEGTVYCLISEGELNIGSTWESLALAKQNKLDNLVIVVDVNGLQAMGPTKEILDMEPIDAKLMSFGAFVRTIDGHNYTQIEEALTTKMDERPIAVVARTIKGKGVSFMENRNEWHYMHVNQTALDDALKELN